MTLEQCRYSYMAGFIAGRISDYDDELGKYFIRRNREKGAEIDQAWFEEMLREARARGVPDDVLRLGVQALVADDDFIHHMLRAIQNAREGRQ